MLAAFELDLTLRDRDPRKGFTQLAKAAPIAESFRSEFSLP
jgi:hypothetical protein